LSVGSPSKNNFLAITKENAVETLASVATGLTHVIVYGGILCLTILVAKVLLWKKKKPTFEVLGLPIDLDYAWVLIAGLTAAHAYVGYLFLRLLASIVDFRDQTLAKSAWEKLVTDFDKLTIFFSLEPRRVWIWGDIVVSSVAIDPKDPIFLLHLAMAVAVVPAVIRWRGAGKKRRVATILAAWALFLINWYVGSAWALSAGDLKHVGYNEGIQMCKTHEIVLNLPGHFCGPGPGSRQ
jgi:hypothetical protein